MNCLHDMTMNPEEMQKIAIDYAKRKNKEGHMNELEKYECQRDFTHGYMQALKDIELAKEKGEQQ